jgi:hypothetical protein
LELLDGFRTGVSKRKRQDYDDLELLVASARLGDSFNELGRNLILDLIPLRGRNEELVLDVDEVLGVLDGIQVRVQNRALGVVGL